MDTLEINTRGVNWPVTPSVRAAMRTEIRRLATEGYRYFSTMTHRCLNGIESPGPDPAPPPGWEAFGFFSDCEPECINDERSIFPDIRLFARKDSPK
jgi:hypothetical protein